MGTIRLIHTTRFVREPATIDAMVSRIPITRRFIRSGSRPKPEAWATRPASNIRQIMWIPQAGAPCSSAKAASKRAIGGRWTVLILRDLLLRGPRRFQDFQDSLKGMAPNTLSDRLKTLEAHGIVERQFYEQHPPRAEYVLTGKGRELGAIVKAMRNWGEKYSE